MNSVVLRLVLARLGVALLTAVSYSTAQAAPKGQIVQPSEVVSTSVPWKGRSRDIACRGVLPGDLTPSKAALYFYSFKQQLADIKLKLRTATGKKRTSLLAKQRDTRSLQALATTLCKSIPAPTATPEDSVSTPTPTATPTATETLAPGAPTRTPTPTPTATKTPTPTPTPNPLAVFDSEGNVTTVGKQFLGIPVSASANIDRGAIVQRLYCAGCHVERTMYKYDQLYPRITQDPMYIQVPQQVTQAQVYDLCAYLNRFRELAQ